MPSAKQPRYPLFFLRRNECISMFSFFLRLIECRVGQFKHIRYIRGFLSVHDPDADRNGRQSVIGIFQLTVDLIDLNFYEFAIDVFGMNHKRLKFLFAVRKHFCKNRFCLSLLF